MPSSPALGGLDLSQIASSAQAESGRRNAGAKGALEASLATMLNEQQGMIAGQGEAQSRANAFERTQAILAETMARRAQTLQEEGARARAAFEAENAPGSENWYAQQRFQTDENIRQAKALGAMDRQYQKTDRKQAARDADREAQPRLSDFGRDAINPYRGQALEGTRSKATGAAGWLGLEREVGPSQEELAATSDLIREYGADPNALMAALREQYGTDDEAASVALWRLGYGTGG